MKESVIPVANDASIGVFYAYLVSILKIVFYYKKIKNKKHVSQLKKHKLIVGEPLGSWVYG